MDINVTLEQLGLAEGYCTCSLSGAVEAYVLATYGETATVTSFADNGDGTVHIIGTV